MSDKSVETQCVSKTSIWETVPHPLPPKTMFIFPVLGLHRPGCLHNTELGGRGYQRINAKGLKYRKASFSKSVSTTFVYLQKCMYEGKDF